MMYLQRVQVCAYRRIRYGRVEFVRAHTRSWPGQLEFNFMT